MATSIDHIFNRKTLKSAIEKSQFPENDIFQKKISVLQKWKDFIESQDIFKEKEKSLDGSFLQDIFSEVLGYRSRLDDQKEWTLRHEQKTKFDLTTADGALGILTPDNEDIQVVIELKGAKTDLDAKQNRTDYKGTSVEQAFGYIPKSGKNCKWAIVSNFVELRLYHSESMIEYELFKIADLTEEEELKRFFFLLSCENLISKEKSSEIVQLYAKNEADEERISKEFYTKYKQARVHLFNHIKSKNTGSDEVFYLEKTQKLLDRFIFICFCEDTGLLEERIFRKVVTQAKQSYSFAENKIWGELKGLFKALDKGAPDRNINAFNGGIFAEDPALDKLIIEDEIFEELAVITDYDFDSDINVDILGHIFEQSISDLEELRADINEEEVDKKKGKRKKDGIFYTPEYITKYIVENAIGSWLEDRKKELLIDYLPVLTDKDYESIRRAKKGNKLLYNKNIEKHIRFWTEYKEKLANIKVLDPACGSGAFLVQAFDYLHREGQIVNKTLSDFFGGQLGTEDLNKNILSNNLYGVDLNSESVEITKLSLWIKTANKFSQLTILKDNIKCGNSLIDDPAVAGEKAFKWDDEYPWIKKSIGFDVVIGNPPYVGISNLNKVVHQHFEKEYSKIHTGYNDLMYYFLYKGILLLNNQGKLGMITSNYFIGNEYAKSLRAFLSSHVSTILNFGDYQVFQDANIHTAIIFAEKTQNNKMLEYPYNDT